RWGDSFNLSQEFVIPNQARSLAYLTWLMAHTPEKNQPWKSATAEITWSAGANQSGKTITAKLSADNLDLSHARIVWEAEGQEPILARTFSFAPGGSSQWLEAEAQLPDGRRVFVVTNAVAK